MQYSVHYKPPLLPLPALGFAVIVSRFTKSGVTPDVANMPLAFERFCARGNFVRFIRGNCYVAKVIYLALARHQREAGLSVQLQVARQ